MSIPIWRGCAAAVLLACVAASPRATTQTDILLNVPTLKGGASLKGFTGWIDLKAYTVGVRAGKDRSKPGVSVLQFTKLVDRTTPGFADSYFSNKPFAGSTKLDGVILKNNAPATTFEIQFHDATVVADSTAGGGTGANETISMSYDAIEYCATQSTGQTECRSWNFKNGTPVYPSDKK